MIRYSKSLFFVVVVILSGCALTKNQSYTKERLVKSYINAKNSYNTKKLDALIDENYQEIFNDGTIETENKAQLVDMVLWGEALDSHINLLDISLQGESVVTIEEYTNYLDVALKRKSRKFKIIYTFKDAKILHQKMDTVYGHREVAMFNYEKYKEFSEYCEQNNLIYINKTLNRESGMQLRKTLEQYKAKGVLRK